MSEAPTYVYVLRAPTVEDESDSPVMVFAQEDHAMRRAWNELRGIDTEAIDQGLPDYLQRDGFIFHAMYGPDDSVVSVQKVAVL